MNRLPLWMILAMMLWGGGWPALKILSEDVAWDVIVFWRFALMSLSFLPILIWYKVPIRLSSHALGWIGFSSVLNTAFMGLSFWGVMIGTAGAGGVIITTLSPILTVLIAVLFLARKPSRNHWFGLGLGLLGGMVMLEIGNGELFVQSGNLLFILCAAVWAVLTLSAQRSHLHIDPIHYSFFLSLIATVGMFFYAFPHHLESVFEHDGRFWGALIYLAVLGQTVASTIYFIASGNMGSSRASSYMFLVPVCALVSSYYLLDEVPTPSLLVGGVISMAAVYLINRPAKT